MSVVHLPCLGTLFSVCLNEFVGNFKLDRFGIRGWHAFYEPHNPFHAGQDLHVIIIKCSKTNKCPLLDLTGSEKANGLGGAKLTYTPLGQNEKLYRTGSNKTLKIVFTL